MTESSAPPFYTRYGFVRTGDRQAPLAIEPYPEICVAGALRATVVASAVDMVGGFFTREAAGRDATFTADLSVRIPRPGRPARLLARGEPLRVGRRLVSTSVAIEAQGEGGARPYAYGETTFSRIPRPEEDARTLEALSTPLVIERHPLDRRLDREVGIVVVSAADGRVELPLRPALLNAEGGMQGALVALVVECAALAMADARGGGPHVVTALDLRYLAAASRGPVVGRGEWIGEPAAGMLRVALRDRGRDERLTTVGLVQVAAAAAPQDEGGRRA